MGKVATATSLPSMILMPFGPLLGGLLLDHYHVVVPLGVIAVLAVVPFLVAVLSPNFRTIPKLSEVSAASTPAT